MALTLQSAERGGFSAGTKLIELVVGTQQTTISSWDSANHQNRRNNHHQIGNQQKHPIALWPTEIEKRSTREEKRLKNTPKDSEKTQMSKGIYVDVLVCNARDPKRL